MASPVSQWLQRMPPELDRKLERAEALAREALIDVHANLALDLVSILAPRMPFDDAIERYLETMDLDGEEKERDDQKFSHARMYGCRNGSDWYRVARRRG